MWANKKLTLFIGMVDIEQGEVVTVDVGKPHLSLVCLLPDVGGTNKNLWH